MTRRGRPRNAATAQEVRLTIRLTAGIDDDLLAFFAGLPPRMRATAIKIALRSGHPLVSASPALPADEEEDLGDFFMG